MGIRINPQFKSHTKHTIYNLKEKKMTNNFYAVAYKLYTIKNGERTLSEDVTAQEPFTFITGFGTTIPEFALHIEKLGKGDSFDFTIPQANAFGEYIKERIVTLDKQIFNIDGKFAEQMIYEGAIIPLQNADGNNFMGRVLEISTDKVIVDLNHPLAGCDLQFQGEVLECHEATNEEIQQMINSLSGGGCGGCKGGGCHGGCHNEGEGNCENGCEGGCEGGCGGCH